MDLLVEDAELVADAVTDGRALEGGQRVEITRGEPAKAAVAQPRFLLAGQHLVEVQADDFESGAGRLLDPEVQQVAAELGAHQELGREIARDLPAEVERRPRRRRPVVQHAVADGQRSCPVEMLRREHGGRAADRVAQVVDDAPPQCVGGQPATAAFRHIGRGDDGCSDDVGHRRSVAESDVAQMNFGRA